MSENTQDNSTPLRYLNYLLAGLFILLALGLLYFLLNRSLQFRSIQQPVLPTQTNHLTTSAQENNRDQTIQTTQVMPITRETIVPDPEVITGLQTELVQLKEELAQQKAVIAELQQPEAPTQSTNDAATSQQIATAQRAQDTPIEATTTPMNGTLESRLRTVIADGQTNTALTFDQVSFKAGSAALNAESDTQIKAVAKVLRDQADVQILIRGHTDNSGSAKNNSLLSLQRSSSTKDALVKQGVDQRRINIEGVGPLEPIAPNDVAEGRQQNRRIELVILP